MDDTEAITILCGVFDEFRSPVLSFDFALEDSGLVVAGAEVTDRVLKHETDGRRPRHF